MDDIYTLNNIKMIPPIVIRVVIRVYPSYYRTLDRSPGHQSLQGQHRETDKHSPTAKFNTL